MCQGHSLSAVGNAVNEVLESAQFMGKALIVANMGVWYKHSQQPEREQYKSHVKDFIEYLIDRTKSGHHVLFRETSAQHFHTKTGEYSDQIYVNKREPDVRSNL